MLCGQPNNQKSIDCRLRPDHLRAVGAGFDDEVDPVDRQDDMILGAEDLHA